MSKKILLTGKINGRHGFSLDFAKTETLSICTGCKAKITPQETT